MQVWMGALYAQSPVIDSLRTELAVATEDTSRAILLNKIGWALRNYDLDSAMSVLEECITLSREIGFKKFEAHAMGNLASLWYVKGDYVRAENLLKEAMDYLVPRDPLAGAMLRNTLALIYRKRGEFPKAREQFEIVLDYFESINDSARISYILNNIGGVFSEQGKSAEALDYYYRSAQIKEALGDYKNAVSTYLNIGDVQRSNENYESAKTFLTKALELARLHKLTYHEGHILNGLGSLHTAMGDTVTAFANFEQALAINEGQGNMDAASTSLLRIGEILTYRGQHELALDYLHQSLKITQDQGKNILLSPLYIALARTYDGLGNTDEAIRYYAESIRIEEEVPNIELRHISYNRLSDLYARTGQFEKAYQAKLHAYADLDSIQHSDKARHIAELETQYQTRHKEALLAEQQLTISRQENRQKNLLIGALLLIGVIGGVLLFLRHRAVIRRNKAESALRIQEMESAQLREMDKLKSSFLANITHEFRTPITLLLGPLRQMLDGSLQGDRTKYLQMMEQNAQRLLTLVNQLLDISKIEAGKRMLRVAAGDLATEVRTVAYAFESNALSNDIQYTVDTPESVHVYFDGEAVTQMLTNLIANALKFTPQGGTVSVRLAIDDNAKARITVADTGPGISEKDLPHIFERFYQGESAQHVTSTGIGLSLSRELARMHHGDIAVTSATGEGSTFMIWFPVNKDAYAASEIQKSFAATVDLTEGTPISSDASRSTVLVVEDNADVRNYITEQLNVKFTILSAVNGEQGFTLATEHIPDLVITDIMMPVMDGMELARKLREDLRTSHIPLIMLTARSAKEDKLAGLEAGGEVYLTKPFDPEELLIRAEEMIRLREQLRKKYQKSALFVPESDELTNQDNNFLQNVHNQILANLSDEQFSVVTLSETLHMSRGTLHRKLKSLTGQSPNELIRHMRLEKAKQMLQGDVNISEVAFAVGFNSLAYFSKCYKDKYGHSPSDSGKAVVQRE